MRRAVLPAVALLALGATLHGAGGAVTLIDAVKHADRAAIRALVHNRADVNAPDVDGTTALQLAVEQDDAAIVKLLLDAGADARIANRYGVGALSLACTNGNAVVAEQLIKAGADVNVALPGGETPLMTAARTGRPDVLKVLLTHGAKVDAREETRGQTALMWAAAEGNAAAIRTLVEAGADIHARASSPPSQRSVPKPKPGAGMMSQGLGSGGRVDAFTPILFAVRGGYLDAVRTLAELGADVNETAPDGSNLLILAAINAHWELMVWLADHGADPNAAATGYTPLHQIARTRTLSLTRFPLPVATGKVSGVDAARALIAHGASVNARMTQPILDGYRNSIRWAGATPFYLAAKGVDVPLMRALVAAGADWKSPNSAGTTPLMAAAGIELHYLGEDDGTPADAIEAVRLLADLGADVNAVNASGDTALHGAARRGLNAMVQILLDKGARVDVRNRKGWTPLTVALGFEKNNPVALFQSEQNMLQTARLLRDVMQQRGVAIDENVEAMQKVPAGQDARRP